MRRDTVGLVTQAVAENRQTYVLVNNRAEGNAPATIQAIVDELETQMSSWPGESTQLPPLPCRGSMRPS
jgi:uncharacterized protein YecE (DUF72 family)